MGGSEQVAAGLVQNLYHAPHVAAPIPMIDHDEVVHEDLLNNVEQAVELVEEVAEIAEEKEEES